MEELTFSASDTGVVVHGSTDLTKDRQGLKLAENLSGKLQDTLAKKHRFKPAKEEGYTSLKLIPFQNESDAVSIGKLNIENRLDRVSVYGELYIADDVDGYLAAAALSELVSSIVSILKADKDIPDSIQIVAPESVSNPFFRDSPDQGGCV
jgi:hypothetical protein